MAKAIPGTVGAKALTPAQLKAAQDAAEKARKLAEFAAKKGVTDADVKAVRANAYAIGGGQTVPAGYAGVIFRTGEVPTYPSDSGLSDTVSHGTGVQVLGHRVNILVTRSVVPTLPSPV